MRCEITAAWLRDGAGGPGGPPKAEPGAGSAGRAALILSASDVPLEDISQLVGHVSTGVTETVYRHEIRPALTKGATAIDKILKQKPTKSA
jgi:integrase